MMKVEKFIQECIQQNLKVIPWYVLGDLCVQAEVNITSYSTSHNEIHCKFSHDQLEYLEQMVSGSGEINFYLPNHGVIFSSELKKLEKNELIISMPVLSEWNERRESERLDQLGLTVVVRCGERSWAKNCFNLSSGGVAIVFTKAESIRDIKEGDDASIEIRSRGEALEVSGSVASIVKLTPYKYENTPYGGNRVSFRFVSDLDKLKVEKLLSSLSR